MILCKIQDQAEGDHILQPHKDDKAPQNVGHPRFCLLWFCLRWFHFSFLSTIYIEQTRWHLDFFRICTNSRILHGLYSVTEKASGLPHCLSIACSLLKILPPFSGLKLKHLFRSTSFTTCLSVLPHLEPPPTHSSVPISPPYFCNPHMLLWVCPLSIPDCHLPQHYPPIWHILDLFVFLSSFIIPGVSKPAFPVTYCLGILKT